MTQLSQLLHDNSVLSNSITEKVTVLQKFNV